MHSIVCKNQCTKLQPIQSMGFKAMMSRRAINTYLLIKNLSQIIEAQKFNAYPIYDNFFYRRLLLTVFLFSLKAARGGHG